MQTSPTLRGVSVLPLVAALVTTFACSGSPTEPGAVNDSAIVSRSQSSELTPREHAAGAVDQDATDENDLEVSGLTASAAARKGTVILSGVIKDKNSGRTISGVTVKIGTTKATSSSKGVYKINVPTTSISVKFSKAGYTTFTKTMRVARATIMNVTLVPTPVGVSSVTLNDSSVGIGAVVTATVKLTNAAPSGGAIVALSSTSPAVATVSSSSITIPAGAKSKTFTVKANAAGATKISAKYNKTSDSASLTVTGPIVIIVPPPVARFTVIYGADGKCAVIANPNAPPPLVATCTFDASTSTAPPGSRYTWTLPGPNVFANRTSDTISNMELTCGSLPNGVLFERTVYLTITAPNGLQDTNKLDVKFKKSGLC